MNKQPGNYRAFLDFVYQWFFNWFNLEFGNRNIKEYKVAEVVSGGLLIKGAILSSFNIRRHPIFVIILGKSKLMLRH